MTNTIRIIPTRIVDTITKSNRMPIHKSYPIWMRPNILQIIIVFQLRPRIRILIIMRKQNTNQIITTFLRRFSTVDCQSRIKLLFQMQRRNGGRINRRIIHKRMRITNIMAKLFSKQIYINTNTIIQNSRSLNLLCQSLITFQNF